jgi:uncharacterized protein YegJ (DUF2314 family)
MLVGLALLGAPVSAVAEHDHLSWPADDAQMKAATARARSELPGFFARLAAPAADEGEFMVRYDIIPGKEAEYVWVDRIERSGTLIKGELLTQPQRGRGSAGDRVTIGQWRIVDWAYRKGKVMQGAYTERAMIARVPADETYFLREHLGWN